MTAILARKEGDGQKALLKELGFDNAEDAKAALAKLKEIQTKDQTETERLTTEKAASDKKAAEESARANKAEKRLVAIELGVAKDYLDDVIALVPDGDEPLEDRMKDFLQKRPMYLAKNPGNLGGATNSAGGKTKEQAITERLRTSMGLKNA